MKVVLPIDVLEAARRRVAWLFDEFQDIQVDISGGKDSTIVLNLALEEAERRGRLPLPVLFVDQEAEWPSVIEYMRRIAADPRVEMRWLQIPFRLQNAMSHRQLWLRCWEPGEEWLREKEPGSIHENRYGTDRFKKLFERVLAVHYPDRPAASISGVRAEESQGRATGLTNNPTYKHITWGATKNKQLGHYTFCPIYDWSWRDVWKAIHDRGWDYCEHYDHLFQRGVRVNDMRISSLHHETSVRSLFWLQEIAPEMWVKLTRRLPGINTAKHLREDLSFHGDLPWMFASWAEFLDHLVEHLAGESDRERYRVRFAKSVAKWRKGVLEATEKQIYQTMINCLLANDIEFTKLVNWELQVRASAKKLRERAAAQQWRAQHQGEGRA